MTTFPQLYVYKASAGSGKTFTLAVQYIRQLIEDPHAYRHILAVTFTNKATAEMKERILSQLYGLATGDAASDGYLNEIRKATGKTDQDIRQAARDALRYIIHDYSRFRIETIDSFFQSVMRNLARELELGANLSIELNNSEVLSEAVDTMIEKLDRRSPVLGWLLEYIEERIDADRRWNVSDEIKGFGRNIFDEEYIERGEGLRKKLEDPAFIPSYRKKLHDLQQEALSQMAGFCGSHGGLYGFIITHLTQKDYIGALAEGGTKRSQVTLGVGADLSLADNAAVMAVKIFQRIFQGNNVAFPGVVNPVNEAGHSGRFTASGRTGDKDHAACIIRNTHHIFRNGKLCRIRQPEGDHTDHGSQGTTLFISVDTETGDAGNGKRKVIVTGFQKPGYITVFRKCIDGAQKCFRFGWHQSVTTAEKVAIHFFGQRTACDDKNIGDPFIGSFCKKFRNWSIHLFTLL